MNKCLFAAALLASVAWAEDSRQIAFQTALPATEAPKIDGVLDDACWSSADWNDRYYEYVKANPKRVSPGTRNAIVWDAQGLYLAVSNPEPNLARMRRSVTRNHHGLTWCDDCAEIYIDPDAKGIGFYKFSVNSRGCYDDQWQMDRANMFDQWNGEGVQAAARVDETNKVWTLELFVPWRAMARGSAMQPGELLMFNHNRFRYAGRGWADFCSSAPEADYRRPENFGYVLISSGELPAFKDIATRISERLKQSWYITIGPDLAYNDEDGLHFTSAEEFAAQRKAAAERLARYAKLITGVKTNPSPERCEIPARKELEKPSDYDGHNGYYLHRLQGTIKTAHLDWGRALASKPKVIFGVNYYGSKMRHVAELMQRVDLDCEVFTQFWSDNLGGHGPYDDPVSGGTPNEAEARFGNLLRTNPEVVAFWNFNYSHLRADFRYEIARRMKVEGLGLLLIDSELPPEFKKHVRLPDIERAILNLAPGARGTLRAYAFGRGRLITLAKLPEESWSPAWRAKWENHCAFLGRVVLAAAGKLTSELEVAKGRGKDSASTDEEAIFIDSKAPAGTRIDWRIRNEVNEIVRAGSRDAMPNMKFTMDDLAGGSYTLDLISRNTKPFWKFGLGADETTREFGLVPFSVESAVGQFEIVAPHYVDDHGPFLSNIRWERRAGEKLLLKVSLRDLPHRRLRVQKEILIEAGVTNAIVPFGDYAVPTRAALVEARLYRARATNLIVQAHHVLCLPDANWPVYPQINWEGLDAGGLLELHAPRMVEEYGWTCNLGENGPGSMLFNAWGQPVIGLLRMGKWDSNNAVRGTLSGALFHWNSERMGAAQKEVDRDENPFRPEVRAIVDRECRAWVTKSRAYAHLCYNLGDECGYSVEAGYGPSDKTIFPEFLSRKYGSIENYNAIRGTNYATFAEIPHKRIKAAREEGDTQSWFDQIQYAEAIYAEAMKIHRDAIVKYEPRARVGAEGSAPGDLELTVRNLKYWGPYKSRVQNELLREIAPPDMVRGVWWGGYVNEPRDGLIRILWESLLTGGANCNLWYTAEVGSTMGFENGAFEPAPYFLAELPHLEALRWGRGQQMVVTPLHRQGLALWYSHESNHAAAIDESCAQPCETQNAFLEFCYRHGLGVEIITKNRLDALARQKLVMVAGGHALTDAEIAALKNFAAQGGSVVFDVTPCRYTSWMTRRRDGENPLSGVGETVGTSLSDAQLLDLVGRRGIVPMVAVEGAESAPRTIVRLRDGADFTLVGVLFPVEADGGSFKLKFTDGRPRHVYQVGGDYLGCLSEIELDAANYPWYEYAVFDEPAQPPAPVVTRKGRSVSFGLQNLRPNGVYRVEISGPRSHREVLCVKDLAKPWRFDFALDDEPGDYEFKLIDLATGLAVEYTGLTHQNAALSRKTQ